MNNVWGKTALAFTLVMSSASLPLASVWADQPAPVAAANAPAYQQLTDVLQVQVKSVLNEKTSDGVRIGLVVNLRNNSADPKRIPDYELRAKTADGAVYTLVGSSSNARSALPMSDTELSYMVKLTNKEAVTLSELQWVDVDWNVYPKTETAVLTVPASGLGWAGSDAVITDPAAIKNWGEPFAISSSNLPLTYTPVDMDKQTNAQKTVYVVKMLVENTGTSTITVPDLILEGKDGISSFQGKQVEQAKVTVEPGEKKYVHYAVETNQDTVLKSINVLTPESFVQTDAKGQAVAVNYNVGRVQIVLPEGRLSSNLQPVTYNYNDKIVFDSINKAIPADVDVSLVELSMHENQGIGYKTAVAKFKLTNRSDSPLPLPAFGTELDSPQGVVYTGSRQVNPPKQLMPKLSHIVTYSFVVPNTESGENLVLKLSDMQTAAPYRSAVAALNVAMQPLAEAGDVLSFYPFQVKVENWSIQAYTNLLSAANPTLTYGYKLKMFLDVKQTDDVVVDQDFSKMKVALVDSAGRTLAEQNLSFTETGGINQLVSGEVIVDFNKVRADYQDPSCTIQVYESIQTEFGEAKRLVAVFK
ncbi:hypothetical protein ACFQ88_16315 [Paenibacillus sp. NPDC056579]|uniref:hypothetical protein n=1 Tax=unclassified Paenibacillus TaxID=185978 RepID=UPI001EF7EF3C|nr:hypothetical protein [Paenibacillus sp. H1-7]ULL17973.1 hypothetical protein DVH26_28015 [Paenibacillus sp. H1-7]